MDMIPSLAQRIPCLSKYKNTVWTCLIKVGIRLLMNLSSNCTFFSSFLYFNPTDILVVLSFGEGL